VCWRDNKVNTGSGITDRGYELRSLNSSLCKKYTDNQETKYKTFPKDRQELNTF
jgi:hypothetical protein